MPFGLIQVLLGFGILVVVPLAVDVLATATPDPERNLLRRARSSALLPGLLAAVSLLLPQDSGGAIGFSLPWLLVSGAVTFASIRSWLRAPSLEPAAVARLAAGGYLTVGAVWLVLDRAGVAPLGLPTSIVLLTAVHFHFAGLAAATIAGRTVEAASSGTHRRIASVGAWLTIGGPPVVAFGFAAWRPAQVAGAALITMGLLSVAHVLFWDLRPRQDDRATRLLFAVAAVAVVVPMFLALHWATGTYVGWEVLDIPMMARTHGALNAFGFSLCGLLAFQRSDRAPGGAVV